MYLRNLGCMVHSYRPNQLVQEMFGHHSSVKQMSTDQSCLSMEGAFATHLEEKDCPFEMVIVIEASFALEMAVAMPSIAVE